MSGFSASWLALREEADRAARAPGLARRFAATLPSPCRLLDLGAGTGANARVLAPVIAGAQDWLLVERDPELLAAQEDALCGWAKSLGYEARQAEGLITVAAPGGSWQFRGLALDLARDWALLAAQPADGVTAAALLDLVSADYLARLVEWLGHRRLPLLAVLTVDGRRDWSPAAPEDAVVVAGFRRHQSRDKGFGPALGGEACARLEVLLKASGWSVTTEASDWRLGPGSDALLAALVAGEAEAARAAEDGAAIARWERARMAEIAAGTAALTIGHLDLLALPTEI